MRIHWTLEEQEMIQQAIVEKLDTKPLYLLVRGAQTVLPPARRRNIIGVYNIPAPLRAWAKSEEERPKQNLSKLLEERDAEIQRLKEEISRLERATALIPTEADMVKKFFSDLIGEAMRKARTTEGFGSALAQLAKAKEASISAEATRLQTLHAKKHNPESEPSGSKKPKVVIVGGPAREHIRLNADFKDSFDLRFFSGDTEGAGIHRMVDVAQSGIVLLWTRNMSHKLDAALRAAKVRVIPVSGQVNAMRAKLSELVREI